MAYELEEILVRFHPDGSIQSHFVRKDFRTKEYEGPFPLNMATEPERAQIETLLGENAQTILAANGALAAERDEALAKVQEAERAAGEAHAQAQDVVKAASVALTDAAQRAAEAQQETAQLRAFIAQPAPPKARKKFLGVF